MIGPYDDSWRFWKYITWIKAKLGLPTKLNDAQSTQAISKKMFYEVPKDNERKLSFTFSVDVVKFILSYLDAPLPDEGFTALNLACNEQLTLVEFITMMEAEIRKEACMSEEESSTVLEPLPP